MTFVLLDFFETAAFLQCQIHNPSSKMQKYDTTRPFHPAYHESVRILIADLRGEAALKLLSLAMLVVLPGVLPWISWLL